VKIALYCSCSLAILAFAPAALAQSSGAIGVDSVVVTANRAPRPVDSVGGQITVLDEAAIRSSQSVAVSDLLARTPGVTVTRNGPIGAATAVRIRGAETDQTVVLIDGVKLNDPSAVGGGYNFGNLLLGDVGRIEVLRGAQSVLWGSQAIGGVVNVITTDPKAPFETTLDAEVGTRRTAYVRAGAGGVSERLTWRLAAAQYATDGFSAFSDDRGGVEKDGFRQSGVTGKARLALTDQLSVDLRGVYTRGRLEFDGFPAPLFAFADTAEYGEREEAVAYAGVNLDLLGGRFKNRLAYAYTDTDSENYNPAQAVTQKTFDSAGTNGRWEYQGTVEITSAWRGVFGAETERSTIRSSSPSAFAPNPPPIRRSATLNGAYAQIHGELVPGLTVTAGVRRDDHSTFGDSTVGQASVAYAFNNDATVLRASWGQGFKAPTLFQLYSDFGNTGLEAEESDSWDAGVEHRLMDGALTVSAAYFERETTNQIDFFSCTAANPSRLCFGSNGLRRFGYYANTASTQAHGVELQGSARPTGRLTVSGNYTWTDTENTSAGSAARGKHLQRRPEHAANAELSYKWPVQLTTAVAVRYAGKSFEDVANLTPLKAYTLVDLRMSYPVSERLEVYGRVENLFDEDYETARAYGGVGRTAGLGLRSRF
jgi:vitamin B12 transporter